MRLKSVQVESYKSLYKPASIQLEPGFNVIVGQNNAGKTALVEAMGLTFLNHPTRTLGTMPDRDVRMLPDSSVTATFYMTGAALRSWLEGRGDYFSLPTPGPSAMAAYMLLLGQLLQQPSIAIQARYTADRAEPAALVDLGNYKSEDVRQFHVNRATGEVEMHAHISSYEQTAVGLSQHLKSSIYAFRAERVVPSRTPSQPTSHLEPDAVNLGAVLLKLQSNRALFDRYNRAVVEVLPQITQVTADPQGGDIADVMVWSIDPETERADLAFPHSACGTGVSQVLAMLYVAVTTSEPRTIIIDEPQSFLHPGAVRKLLGVLKQFPQHQYVITTHSPAVISAANPATLTIVRKGEDGASELEQFDSTATALLEDLLGELGAHLVRRVRCRHGDLGGRTHGGALPEDCGGAGAATPSTRHGHRCRRGHGRLRRRPPPHARGGAHDPDLPAPESIRQRDPHEGGLHLRPRRAHRARPRRHPTSSRRRGPTSLADACTRITCSTLRRLLPLWPRSALPIPAADVAGSEMPPPCSQETVHAWMEQQRWEPAHYERNTDVSAFTGDAWKLHIHAARLLGKMVRHFAGSGYEYLKVEHGAELTRWIAGRAPEEFEELRELLDSLLPPTAP